MKRAILLFSFSIMNIYTGIGSQDLLNVNEKHCPTPTMVSYGLSEADSRLARQEILRFCRGPKARGAGAAYGRQVYGV
jgi:hypothetical protein